MAAKIHVVQNSPVKIGVAKQGEPVEMDTANASQFQAYSGEYDVTPSTYNIQTLHTAKKSLYNDIIVQKIPQFIVSNDEGGKTLIIGEEYYG